MESAPQRCSECGEEDDSRPKWELPTFGRFCGETNWLPRLRLRTNFDASEACCKFCQKLTNERRDQALMIVYGHLQNPLEACKNSNIVELAQTMTKTFFCHECRLTDDDETIIDPKIVYLPIPTIVVNVFTVVFIRLASFFD